MPRRGKRKAKMSRPDQGRRFFLTFLVTWVLPPVGLVLNLRWLAEARRQQAAGDSSRELESLIEKLTGMLVAATVALFFVAIILVFLLLYVLI